MAIDFIRDCLELDPRKRKTADQLFEHQLFSTVRQRKCEVVPDYRIECKVDLLKGKDYSVSSLQKFVVKLVHKVKESQ